MKKGEKSGCAKFFVFYSLLIWIFVGYLYLFGAERGIEIDQGINVLPEEIKELIMEEVKVVNEIERIIVIGDVHGCAVEFRELLEKVKYRKGVDKVILVGDLVGKGPYSKEVLQIAMDIEAQCVRGNHDDLIIRYYQHKTLGLTDIPLPSLKPSYKDIFQSLSKDKFDYMLSWPYYIVDKEKKMIIVHAGLVPGEEMVDQDPEVLMNIRNIDAHTMTPNKDQGGEAWIDFWNGPEMVLFGHDAVRGLQLKKHDKKDDKDDKEGGEKGSILAVGLDSGACYGGELSALILPDLHIVQVKAHQVYEIPKLKLSRALPPL